MALTLHNTLSRTREPFVPADPQRVTMYVCGPTVYNFAHIGNARPAVVFDVLARLLRRRYALTYARNVTDVDDKINNAAREEGVDIGVLTGRYLDAYQADMTALGVAPPDVEPRVTAHLPEIVRMIERLIAAGHAYEAEGHVLFDVPSYADYGRLSGRDTDELVAGARVEVAPYKRYAGDFVLWKPSPPDVVGWPSPWGRGRPGWHIECSAMVRAASRRDDRHPRRRRRPRVPASRERGRAEHLRACGQDLRALLAAQRLGRRERREDVEVARQFPARARRCSPSTAASPCGSRCSRRTTASRSIGRRRSSREARQNLDRLYGALRDAGVAGAARGARGGAERAGGRARARSRTTQHAARAERAARRSRAH